MAESLGFVLGAHTIPPGIPIMYVTDSNNARTLQRNLANPHLFTHRKMVRKVKQGIDHAIANHLQLLTPPQHNWQDNSYEQELYGNGHENCQSWARLLNDNTTNEELLDNGDNSGEHNNNFNYHNSNAERGNDPSTSSQSDTPSGYFSDDSSSTASDIYNDLNADTETNRYRFDDTMFDILPNIVIVKVFSHQLDNEFISKCPGKNPKLNICVASANQFADNAVSNAHDIIAYNQLIQENLRYPAFSPRWCFSCEGINILNGAHKLLNQRIDDELFL
jgi:hypothetical protein